MSRYSIDFFSRFDEVVGHPADYRPHGYLFCATNDRHLAYLKANRERQISLGVKNVDLVSREEIAKFVPQLRIDDIVGGTFCPTDGFVDPHSVMMVSCLKRVNVACACGSTLKSRELTWTVPIPSL